MRAFALSFAFLAVACSSSSSTTPSAPEDADTASHDSTTTANDADASDAATSDVATNDATTNDTAEDSISPADAVSDTTTPADAGDAGAPSRWIPAKGTTFFWDLQSAPPDNSHDVGAYDIDGFNNDAAEVAKLHALGKKAVCYIDLGTYEPGRPDSGSFPSALLGNDVQGWPGEKWLDVRPSGPNYATLQSIMKARVSMCASKGFDAVEPDNIDSYTNDPGFTTTAADQLAYNRWIAATVHAAGMAVFQKNDLDQIPQLVGEFDGVLDEECNKYGECATLAPYVTAGKPAWNAEYTDDGETTAKFCSADQGAGIVGALFSLDLDGTVFQPCADDVGNVH